MSALQAIDFNRHARGLARLIPNLHCFEVYDEQGGMCFSSDAEKQHSANTLTRNSETHTLCQSIHSRDQTRLGTAVVIVNGASQGQQTALRQHIQDVASDTCANIAHELDLLLELDAMADELGKRYEELNLVYNVKDHADNNSCDFAETLHSLQYLIDDCATFFHADQAVLLMPDRQVLNGRSIYSDSCTMPPGNQAAQLTIADAVIAGGESVVVNNANKRHICAPILLQPGTLAGALLVSSEDPSGEFSNSDRQLVEIQAEMAKRMLQSCYDPLTGLMTRNPFEYRFRQQLDQQQATLLLFHCNHFKLITDTFGSEASNRLLQLFSDILQNTVPKGSLISRLDTDEFAVAIESAVDYQAVIDAVLDAIDSCLSTQRPLPEGCDFSVNVGIVEHHDSLHSVDDWIIAGDLACQLAKDNSFERQHRYSPDDEALEQRRSDMLWVGRVKKAILQQSFSLYCQPMAALDEGKPHFEILLRILDDDGQPLPPGKFISAAERYELMPSIDEWVVNEALRLLSSFDISSIAPESTWSINLSGQSLSSERFKQFLADRLAGASLDNHQICFEITETAAIGQFDSAMSLVTTLKAMGARFSLDDFGSGLSSFSYLKEIPVDYLKIDGSFVRDIESSAVNFSMVQAMNSIGKLMDIHTIAEFVENDSIMGMLRAIGVDYAQGYAVSRPLPLERVLADITAQTFDLCL